VRGNQVKSHFLSGLTLGAVILSMLTLVGIGIAQEPNPRIIVRPRFIPPSSIDPRAYEDLGKLGQALPTWSGKFIYQGHSYPFTMIGTDPSKGSATTTLKFVIIPLAIKFLSNGTVLDPTVPLQKGCGTGTALKLSQDSPVLRKVDWKQGPTDVGKTQYLDAFQRAEFWNFVGTTAPDYHLLLAPVVVAKQTLTVPANQGSILKGDCGVFGNVNTLAYFDGKIQLMLSKLKIQRNELPYFLTYDVLEQLSATGYHNVSTGGVVYATGAFFDQNVFGPPDHAFDDVVTLSHEIGETINDPLITNATPNWHSTYAPLFGCQSDLEVGDPLAGKPEPVMVPGVNHVFYVQDLAFVPWFARAAKSNSVNHWYSMFGTFKNLKTNTHC
jgi:hypothetical protein